VLLTQVDRTNRVLGSMVSGAGSPRSARARRSGG
jgi:hypothetical protein